MTTQTHDHPVSSAIETRGSAPSRPRWLLPALGAGAVVVGLVAAGVVSLTAVIYVGAFGGMMLMHLMPGMHGGHGGHAGHGAGDQAQDGEGADLAPSAGGGAAPKTDASHGGHGSHGCH